MIRGRSDPVVDRTMLGWLRFGHAALRAEPLDDAGPANSGTAPSRAGVEQWSRARTRRTCRQRASRRCSSDRRWTPFARTGAWNNYCRVVAPWDGSEDLMQTSWRAAPRRCSGDSLSPAGSRRARSGTSASRRGPASSEPRSTLVRSRCRSVRCHACLRRRVGSARRCLCRSAPRRHRVAHGRGGLRVTASSTRSLERSMTAPCRRGLIHHLRRRPTLLAMPARRAPRSGEVPRTDRSRQDEQRLRVAGRGTSTSQPREVDGRTLVKPN